MSLQVSSHKLFVWPKQKEKLPQHCIRHQCELQFKHHVGEKGSEMFEPAS